jgi:thiol-disulfide isomerase/thioredoxin
MKITIVLLGAASILSAGLLISVPDSRKAKPVPGNQPSVSQTITGLTAVSLAGDSVSAPVPGVKATVIAFSSVTCPLCQKYEPTLAALEDSYAARGVKFVFVNPMSTESAGEMKRLVKRLKLDGPYIHDPEGQWAKALGAKTTTETFLLDKTGKLIYRGAIDDQYAIGAALPKPKNRYLAEALDSILAGKPVMVKSTSAPGCLLNEGPMKVAEAIPTFHGKVQHIVQRSCMPCHREGGIAPFSLDDFGAVKSRAKMLEFVVDEGIMPPWFAKKGGPWRNDMSLPDADKAALKAWIAGGTPKGDPKDAPTPLVYASGWNIRKPDAVFQLPEPLKIKESGVMPYANVNVPTNFTEDKWVEKIEVVPGDRRAVHHVLVFVRSQGTADLSRRERIANSDARDELSGFFGIYVPGNSTLTYPKGLAKRIPKGAILRFQIHYTPYGQASTDQTKIGFAFAKEPPKSEVHTASVANLRFSIPPGADNHKVEAQIRVPTDVQILSYLPHMHVRAKAARYELEAGGKTTTLLDVPKYDFNWQLNYVLKTPLDVRAGDTVHFDVWYDNSDKNPANPDPTKTVRWGSQTFDEMHLGYIEYIIPGEKPGEGGSGLRRRPGGAGGAGGGVTATFRRLDRNNDGFVTEAEASALWNRIRGADANGDGKVSLEEATKYFGGGRPR